MDNMNYDKESSPVVTKQQLVADLNLVLSDVDALIRATANQGGAEISKVRTQIADSVTTIKTRMANAELALLDKGKRASKIADDYVRENPWRNLGVAAGVGLLIGILIGRR